MVPSFPRNVDHSIIKGWRVYFLFCKNIKIQSLGRRFNNLKEDIVENVGINKKLLYVIRMIASCPDGLACRGSERIYLLYPHIHQGFDRAVYECTAFFI